MVAVIWIDPEKCQFLKISLHIYLPCSVSCEYILTASHFNNIDTALLFFVSKLSEKFWITEIILFITAFSFCSKELKLHPDVNSSLHFLYFPKSPTPNHIPMESWIPVPLHVDLSQREYILQLKVTNSLWELITNSLWEFIFYRKLGYRQWRKGSGTSGRRAGLHYCRKK